MKQLFIKQGEAVLEDVPPPECEPGTALVRVSRSCISTGTELSGVRNSAQPLWRRAMAHPEEVRKVVSMAATQGLMRTQNMVRGRLADGLVVGYSAAGTVVAVGSGVDDLAVGERVACAGTGYASHAETIRVPRNLVCLVPESVGDSVASTVALGAIAMQGVRRAQPTLGETFVVIGLGALGQITTQLLRASGCRVIGTDLSRSRIKTALDLGMEWGFTSGEGNDPQRVLRLTRDVGADGVIITASSPADGIVATAFQMCRRRGRVILVGDVGLSLDRQDIYQKELDFLVSTSYGPGRYDRAFEEKAAQYPVAYVRWTETRNMQEYLDLVEAERIKIAPLIGAEFPFENAANAYQALQREDAPILAILEYRGEPDKSRTRTIPLNPPTSTSRHGERIRLALVGPGGFVRAVHLPNIQRSSDFELRAVVSRSGARASAVATQSRAAYSSTEFDEILGDRAIDAVLIATRHDLHASMALRALRAGKHVFLEKPLALRASEVEDLRAFYAENESSKPILLTGFNRRFSPFARRVKAIVESRTFPMVITYRMNAGFIAPDHWVHDEEGGGRNLGEACHIYDLFTYLTGAEVSSVSVQSIPPASGHRERTDNFIATMRFRDGSIASLAYTSLGHQDFPKEHLEVFVDGKVCCLDDYRELAIKGSKEKGMKTRLSEKGHTEELAAFADGIRSGSWPIPLWQQLQATEVALSVQRAFLAGDA